MGVSPPTAVLLKTPPRGTIRRRVYDVGQTISRFAAVKAPVFETATETATQASFAADRRAYRDYGRWQKAMWLCGRALERFAHSAQWLAGRAYTAALRLKGHRF